MTPKRFALEQIGPYYKDPSTCGIAGNSGSCVNITPDGKMCVAGKNLLPEVRDAHQSIGIGSILSIYENDQSKVFIPEAANILTRDQWEILQCLHDNIARRDQVRTGYWIGKLNLFDVQELTDSII